MWRNQPAARAINRFAIRGEPLTDLAQTLNELGLNGAVGPRPHVQQKVCIRSRRAHEVLHQFARALEVAVARVISPRAIHRLSSFEWQITDSFLSTEAGLVLPG